MTLIKQASEGRSMVERALGLVGVLLTLPMMQAPFTMALGQMLVKFQ